MIEKVATPLTLEHIRDVIKNTTTPSWLGSVPNNFGDAKAGSLKADEWRTLSTVYIPLALISIWGEGSQHDSLDDAKRCREILDHTMALTSAVSLLCKRTVTQARAEAYVDYITQYVRDLKELHPRALYRPNHHAAFHIYDFLILFGPVRSWWCFPFERLIGRLQNLPHNHLFGKQN